MAQTIKLKRSSVQNNVPSTSDLDLGELAINTYDGKLFIKKNDGSATIVQVGGIVGSSELTDGSVTTTKIANNAVTTAKLADNSVGITQLNVSDGSSGQVLTTNGSGTLSFSTVSSGASNQNAFSTVAVSGQNNVVADATTDVLNFAAGSGINITTNASNDTVTITSTATGSVTEAFKTIAVSGQNNVVADGATDTLTFVGGSNMTITTNASNDTVTFASSGSGSSGNTGGIDSQIFNGDGTEDDFTLTTAPTSEDHLWIFVDGVYQNKDSYTISGTTLTMADAPDNGTKLAVHHVRVGIPGTGAITGAMLASPLALTGDFAVDTNVLKVDSTNNRVGINITSPSHPLDVVGNANIVGNTYVSGNLGVGTTSPAFTNGTGLEIEKSGAATLRIQRTGADAAEIFMDSNGFHIKDLSNGTLAFGTANVERMRLQGANLGIGTTSPARPLHIASTSAMRVPIGTTAQRPSGAVGDFRYNSNDGKFEGYTVDGWGAIAGSGGGSSSTFLIQELTGNGSTTAFTLEKTVTSEDNLIVFNEGVFQRQDSYAASGTTITFDTAPASANKLVVYQMETGVVGVAPVINTMAGDGSDATLTLSVAPASENQTIVNIDGVTQHKATYSVSGTTLTFSSPPPSGSAVECITLTNMSVTTIGDDDLDTKVHFDKTADDDVIRFDTAGTERMVIGGTGNVGIGTTSPAYDLDIVDSTTASNTNAALNLSHASKPQIRFVQTSNNTRAYIGIDTNDLVIRNDDGVEKVRFEQNGDLLLNSAGKMQFGDSGTYIHQSADGVLDLVSDSEIEINATTIDMNGAADISGNLVVHGNFTVNGTTTTISTATLDVEDLNITVAKGAADSAAANGGGLTIDGAGASMTWDHGNQYIEFNKPVFSSASFTVGSTSTIVGELKNTSGVMNLQAASTRQVSFSNVANGEHVRIDATGKVGIGVTDPDGELEVRASTVVSGASDTVNSVLMGLQAANRPTIILDTADTSYTNRTWNITNVGSAGSLFIGRNGLDVMIMTNAGKVGVGIAAPDARLHVFGAETGEGASVGQLRVQSSTAFGSSPKAGIAFTNQHTSGSQAIMGGIYVGKDTTANGNYAGHMAFSTRAHGAVSVERMRIDSSGDVLIGQTSQTGYTFAQKLVVGDGDNNDGITIQSGATHQGNLAFNHSDGTTAHGRISYQHNTNYMAFFTNNAERMRLDTGGSMFLGTTGPAMHSAYKGIVFENGALISDQTRSAGKSITLAQNATVDSGNTFAYLATDEASWFQQFGGNHYFVTAPSGSAGSDITGTTRMFIKNTGNVGIGTDNPTVKLDVAGGIQGSTIKNIGSYNRITNRTAERYLTTNFPNGVANQKVQLILANTWWGVLEVSITGTFSNQNMSGVLTKTYGTGLNAGTPYTNANRITESLGATADNFHIGDIEWNSSLEKWVIVITHRVSTGNQLGIRVRGLAEAITDANDMDSFYTSSVYTTDSTVYGQQVRVPSFHAYLTGGTALSANAIVFGTKLFDKGGDYNASNGRFTAPQTGVYSFSLNSLIYAHTGGIVNPRLMLNGSNYGYVVQQGHANNSHTAVVRTWLVDMTKGQYVQAKIEGSSVNSGCNIYGGQTYFTGHLVG